MASESIRSPRYTMWYVGSRLDFRRLMTNPKCSSSWTVLYQGGFVLGQYENVIYGSESLKA